MNSTVGVHGNKNFFVMQGERLDGVKLHNKYGVVFRKGKAPKLGASFDFGTDDVVIWIGNRSQTRSFFTKMLKNITAEFPEFSATYKSHIKRKKHLAKTIQAPTFSQSNKSTIDGIDIS